MWSYKSSATLRFSKGLLCWEISQLITKQKCAFCLKHYTFSIWFLIFVIYIHDEIWHLCFRCHLFSCSSASMNESIIKSATITESTQLNSVLCLCPALGASRGKVRRARQGRRHATARGPASPHSVPAAPTSGHAGRQQSGTLGALQKHSMYREVYVLNKSFWLTECDVHIFSFS